MTMSSSSGLWLADLTSANALINAGIAAAMGNAFTNFAGPNTSIKTFTLPNASCSILTDNAAVTIGQGGTGQATKTAAFDALSPVTTRGDIIARGASNNVRLGIGANHTVLKSDGTDPSWAALTNAELPSALAPGSIVITGPDNTTAPLHMTVPATWTPGNIIMDAVLLPGTYLMYLTDSYFSVSVGMEVDNQFQVFPTDNSITPFIVGAPAGLSAPLMNLKVNSVSKFAVDQNGAITTCSAISTQGDLKVDTVGKGIYVKEGVNATMGVATLVGGTVTVATTKIGANSRVFAFHQNNAGTPGFLTESARVNGTSFTITSSDALDTSDIAWIMIEPA